MNSNVNCQKDLLEEALEEAVQEGKSELCKKLLDYGSHLGDEVASNRGFIPLVRRLQPFIMRKGVSIISLSTFCFVVTIKALSSSWPIVRPTSLVGAEVVCVGKNLTVRRAPRLLAEVT